MKTMRVREFIVFIVVHNELAMVWGESLREWELNTRVVEFIELSINVLVMVYMSTIFELI